MSKEYYPRMKGAMKALVVFVNEGDGTEERPITTVTYVLDLSGNVIGAVNKPDWLDYES